MKYVLSVETDDISELSAFLGGAVITGGKKPVKAKKEPEEDDLLGDEGDGDEGDGEDEASVENIRKLVAQKTKVEKKTDAVKALLKKYKAENVTLLEESKYEAFYAALKKL